MDSPWIRIIEGKLADGFETRLFRAALDQAERAQDPLRANNFAYALRELTRHMLKRLAPDEEIEDSPWYKPVYDEAKKEIITRAQRIKYAIQGPLDDPFVADDLKVEYGDEIRALTQAIKELSRFTHINPDVFDLPAGEVDALRGASLTALGDFVQAMFDCRERVLGAIQEQIDAEVLNAAVEETFSEVDILATHHLLEEVNVEEVVCDDFEGNQVHATASGTMSFTLQFGSSSDRARGDGLEEDHSVSFSCQVLVSLENLNEVTVLEDSLKISESGDESGDPEDEEELF